jgi:hypothetical protein
MKLIAPFGDRKFEIETAGRTTLAYVTTDHTPEIRPLHANGDPLEFPGPDGGLSRMKDFLVQRFGEPTGPWEPCMHTFEIEGEPFDVSESAIR